MGESVFSGRGLYRAQQACYRGNIPAISRILDQGLFWTVEG
jgi:hypothetical protein